tara:strand:+ start:381 stop:725 length:345 start_codon:yes stop_codon:yes gene_type:complete
MGAAKQAFMEDMENYGDVVFKAIKQFNKNPKEWKIKLLDAKLNHTNLDETQLKKDFIAETCEKLAPEAHLSFSWDTLIATQLEDELSYYDLYSDAALTELEDEIINDRWRRKND